MHFSGTPTPPAPSALLPRPAPGQGQCLRYQVNSRIRDGAGGKPCTGCIRWVAVPGSSPGLPMPWTVGISSRGVAACGEGELVPPPLSPTLQPSNFSLASLARAFLPVKHTLSAGSPAPPAPAALLPRPLPGAGSVRGDIR